MKILVNTDKNIDGNAGHTVWLSKIVEESLMRYEDRITRIELHLSDANAGKSGANDKQCTMEARLAGVKPVVVTSASDNIDQAVRSALSKMNQLLSSMVERSKE